MSLGERAREAPWWAHALAYLALLVAVAPFMRWDVPFTPDEGLYGYQVDALQDGSWRWEYPGRPVDADGDWMPLVNAEERGDAVFPYLRHPAYAVALLALEEVGGEVAGPHVLPVLGAAGTAVAAWFLGRRLGAPPALAFWLAGAGPVLVNAQIVWAHALAAALAGAALVALLSLARRWTWQAAAGLAVTSALLVSVRAEGLLFVVAAGAVLAFAVLRRRGVGAAVAAGLPTLAGPAAFLLERWWFARIVETATTGGASAGAVRGVRQASGSYLAGRVGGAWHVLLEPAHDDRRTALVGLLAVGLIALGAVAIRRRLDRHEVVGPALVAAGVVLVAVRFAADPDQTATGLLAAWPVVLVALLLVRRTDLDPAGRLLAWVAGVFTLLVLLTQYDVGGGLEWGGRFLSPVIPGLAAIAAVVLQRRSRAYPALGRVLPALVVVPAVAGLVVVAAKRAGDGALVDQVASAGGDVVVTHEKVLPRYGWRIRPPGGFLLVPDDEVGIALQRLAEAGVDEVSVVEPWYVEPDDLDDHYGTVQPLPAPDVEAYGWRLHRLSDPSP